ncbi:hypothetical protein D9M70_641110 [compost metagenome]
MILGARGLFGGTELDLVGPAFATDQGFRHGEAVGQLVQLPLELLLADRHARQHLVGDQAGVAIGDGDRRQVRINGKRGVAHVLLLYSTGAASTAGAMKVEPISPDEPATSAKPMM